MPSSNFIVNKADLAKILDQIKIAEETSAGYTPETAPVTILQAIANFYGIGAANAAVMPAGLRTVDGTFNNLLVAPTGTPGTPGYNPGTSQYGAADTLFPRLTTPVYYDDADGDTMVLGPGAPVITNTDYGLAGRSVADADPRIISNLIIDMSVNNPAAVETYLNNPVSLAKFAETHDGLIPVAPGDSRSGDGTHLAITNADLQTIANLSPDIGLSPGFNSWMTFFGQFFDHGLDLVTKGGAGTVYIPLQNDDPLVLGADGLLGTQDDLPAHLRFMALTRATQTLDANGVPQHENTTTSFIDQNQTYTSHASHQVFLREYAKVDVEGDGLGPVAVSTGRLLDGTAASGSIAGAPGNWAEVKAQAIEMLGLKLSDYDVHNCPLLVTDQYGKFLPGSNGYAQVVVQVVILDATGREIGKIGSAFAMNGVEGGLDLSNLPVPEGLPDLPAGQSYKTVSVGTGHAFLNDIAHHAAPSVVDHDHSPATPKVRQTADVDVDLDGDGVISAAERIADDGNPLTYDDEMLDAHFITGDGRGNENIALTSVHSIFHAEHNRTVETNKATIIDAARAGDIAFLNEWLVVDVSEIPDDLSTLVWDGERLFQAARFSTEMQYQHLVFEEFARRVQPMVDPFVFNNSPDINPAILAEFAHTVYRFGHSMLTGTVDRLDNGLDLLNGESSQQTLLAMFLNPQQFLASGGTIEEINANIVRGLSRDVGNAIDEFIVDNLRDNLVGLPLDLGALNIARGRDTGVPSLNETRRQLYDDSGLADLKPYESWADFASNLKNPASLLNFIAAYGTHSELLKADVDTLVEKRAVATALVFGGSVTLNAGTDQERVFTAEDSERLDFLHARGTYAGGTLGGLNLVDLWIGGLAEATPEFGGMLGSTFNYVFEAQMEMLQNGDRFYYLSRTQGMNMLNQLEANSFADLVMRNSELGGAYSTHLNGQLFTTPDLVLELDRGIAQEDYNGSLAGRDPTWADGEIHSPLAQKVTRTYTGVTADGGHDVGGTLRFIGGEHVVVGGTEGDDRIYTDRGIDTLWGDGGNDYLNAGTESDEVFGGDGDDIIEDPFGDDMLRGQAGNDVIASARGFDLMFGNEGQDVILVGQDASEVFAGEGQDFVLGGAGKDFVLGNEGDDWLEGGAGFDTLAGDNSELFFNSPLIGHDVMFGHADETDYDAESGDDIMGAGTSVFRYEGMFGFDWSIGKGQESGVWHDLTSEIFAAPTDEILRDRFDHVEALSGYHYNDILEGDDRGRLLPGHPATTTQDEFFVDDILKQDGIDRINGFSQWFGGARETLFGGDNPLVLGSEVATSFRDGNILIGGDGNDVITGRGGYDLIDGDAYLNVRIGININGVYYSAESLNTDISVAGPYAGRVYAMVGNNPSGDVNFAAGPAFGGRSLTSLLLDRTISPGQMSIVREIKYDATNVTGASMNIDTAVYAGTLAEYDIEGRTVDANGIELTRARDVDGDGFIMVRDRDDGVTGATVIIDGVPVTLNSRGDTDETDLIKNIEELRFADQTLVIAGPNLVRGVIVDLHAFDLVTQTTTQYLDTFSVSAFNNSDGTTPWTTSWVESNDGANVVGGGQIQTNAGGTGAMRFVAGDGASITRAVVLDPGQAATLSYTYSFAGIDVGDTLRVEFAANGTDWVTVQTIAGAVANNANIGPTLASFSVNGTANSAIRFTVSTLTGTEAFRIDDVSVLVGTATRVSPADGTGFAVTYTEDDPPVGIASNMAIIDLDNTTMLSASVRLTNAQAGDILSIAGALPAGITSAIDASVPGQITVSLSGVAAKSAYEAAIQAVRFHNSSLDPAVAPRIIEVTATSVDATSAPAISTVNVVSVNDAPVTAADVIVTNASMGDIVIPEWALLQNDSDVDSPSLDISAVSGAVGLNALSLATNAGSVTLSEDTAAGGSFIYTANDGEGGRTNASVSVINTGFLSYLDIFNGLNDASPSAANASSGGMAWLSSSWIESGDDGNIRTGQIQIDAGAAPGTNDLRFGVGDGASITRTVNLAGRTSANLSLAFDKNGIDVGESVLVQFAADGVNFVTLSTITNTNNTAANGNAAGTLSLALTGALSANSAIRFVGSAINTAGEDIRIDNVAVTVPNAAANILAGAGNQVLVGNEAGTQLSGGLGNDIVFAGGGNDIINWTVGDGRDFIDGGTNAAAGDRVVINGDATVESFIVYARAEALAAGVTGLNALTEIVVVRNGVVVAELDNVEEITINTGAGNDSVQAIGNFNPTSLFFNTITVNGGGGRDTINSSQLTSAHKLVLTSAGPAATGTDLSVTKSTAKRNFLVEMNEPGEALALLKLGVLASGALRNAVEDRTIASDHHSPYGLDDMMKLQDSAAHFVAADYLIG